MQILEDFQFTLRHSDASGNIFNFMQLLNIMQQNSIMNLNICCVYRLGASGVQTGLKPRPVSSGPKPVSLYGNSNNDDDGGGGFLENAAGDVFGGDGLFGGGGSSDDGPFEGIGDAFGDLFAGGS